MREGHNLARSLAYLSSILPPSEEIYITQLSVGGQGTIRFAVRAERRDIAKLDNQLRAAATTSNARNHGRRDKHGIIFARTSTHADRWNENRSRQGQRACSAIRRCVTRSTATWRWAMTKREKIWLLGGWSHHPAFGRLRLRAIWMKPLKELDHKPLRCARSWTRSGRAPRLFVAEIR